MRRLHIRIYTVIALVKLVTCPVQLPDKDTVVAHVSWDVTCFDHTWRNSGILAETGCLISCDQANRAPFHCIPVRLAFSGSVWFCLACHLGLQMRGCDTPLPTNPDVATDTTSEECRLCEGKKVSQVLCS